MIRNLELKNFKCFGQESIRMRPLTIIAGGNAAGKSSIIQSLLMIVQSKYDFETNNRLRLDDKLVNLVSSEQVRYSESESPEIKVIVYDDLVDDDFIVIIPDATKADKQPVCTVSANMPEALSHSSLFSNDFVYLHANRLSPQSEYLKGNDERFDSRLGDRLGHRTVFRLQEALDNGEEVYIDNLMRDGKSSVSANVNTWISHILGMRVTVNADGNPVEGRAELIFNTPKSGPVSALNMAFGNTYILPIVLGVLTAKPGSLMIVENPESHLHPKAQLRMGEFLAIAAQGGLQVIVETHSDHLLNGVRVAAKQHKIDPINVAIHFITEKDGFHSDTEIELSEDGTLDNWPPGFFDEWENALREIIRGN
ncbi:MAG: DUF3696 domain-containing protein [Duncaniella sp.]|nr:DUF3696 domain-containing protein [Duncaniella sp.]